MNESYSRVFLLYSKIFRILGFFLVLLGIVLGLFTWLNAPTGFSFFYALLGLFLAFLVIFLFSFSVILVFLVEIAWDIRQLLTKIKENYEVKEQSTNYQDTKSDSDLEKQRARAIKREEIDKFSEANEEFERKAEEALKKSRK